MEAKKQIDIQFTEPEKIATITAGWYKQKHDPKKFKVEIYQLKTGEKCILVPLFVDGEPKNWVKI